MRATLAERRAVDIARSLIWWFYAEFKAYKRNPDPNPQLARPRRARFSLTPRNLPRLQADRF
jgi:hypothetical protein